MCISTTPRNPIAFGRRPAVDAAHLLSQVNVKQEIAAPLERQRETTSSQSSPMGKRRKEHITVQHDYHDHANDSRADYQEEHPARGGVTTPFPLKLHEMLISTAAEGMDDIVSWQPHGRCFLVHKPKEFVALLPRYFKLSKLASFQRQLNLYGFQRLTRGRDRGGYYHELFLWNRVYLSHNIQRIKVKGTGVRARSNPDQEPDFWALPWVNEDDTTVAVGGGSYPQHHPSPKSIMDVPSQLQSSSMMFNKLEDDIILAFGNKTFHYLDPFQGQLQEQPAPMEAHPNATSTPWDGIDELLNGEAESFFEDFDFPDTFGEEIEDDAVFGSLLEQLLAE